MSQGELLNIETLGRWNSEKFIEDWMEIPNIVESYNSIGTLHPYYTLLPITYRDSALLCLNDNKNDYNIKFNTPIRTT